MNTKNRHTTKTRARPGGMMALIGGGRPLEPLANNSTHPKALTLNKLLGPKPLNPSTNGKTFGVMFGEKPLSPIARKQLAPLANDRPAYGARSISAETLIPIIT